MMQHTVKQTTCKYIYIKNALINYVFVIPAICFVGPGKLLAHIPSWSHWSEPATTPDSLSCHGHTAGSLPGLLSR